MPRRNTVLLGPTSKLVPDLFEGEAEGSSTGVGGDSHWSTDRKKKETGRILAVYHKTELFWVALILADLVAQGCRTADSSDSLLDLLSE